MKLFLYKILSLFKSKPKGVLDIRKDLPSFSNTVKYKTIAHEAGHCVAVWYCTGVYVVDRIDLLPDGIAGAVYYSIRLKNSEDYWAGLVIALAGVVAETLVFGKMRSGAAKTDLLQALNNAASILDLDPNFNPPYVDGPTINFDAIYTSKISMREKEILEAGYKFARNMILSKQLQFSKLIGLMIYAGSVNYSQIEPVLGSRSAIVFAGNFRVAFI